MTADINTYPAAVDTLAWPEGLTRVPYWAFQREDVYRDEQQRIFQGKCWNYLCLEVDISNAGDFRTTFVGDAPVIVTRNADGEIHAFENRCAHRGALICLDEHGGKKEGLQLRLSRLDLRFARESDWHCIQEWAQGQRGHATDFLHGGTLPA